jgi:hypothetical protein
MTIFSAFLLDAALICPDKFPVKRDRPGFIRQAERRGETMQAMRWLTGALAAALLATGTHAQGRMLSLDDPAHALQMFRKIQCSTEDLKPVYYHWSGRVYSRVQGEPDRHLWNIEGMNVRQCAAVNDPVRGPGMRMVSRELMFYLDPATGQVVDRWKNPWTGAENRVFHVANDPVSQPPMFVSGRDGKGYRLPVRVEDGRVFWNIEVPLFYPNPLGGDFQTYAGNHYHAMEIFNFVADERGLRDPRSTEVNASVSWVRIAPWLPFMEMGSRPGLMVFNATGQKVAYEALPAVVRDQIARSYPAYRNPPPIDDARPNATTWTEFRRMTEEERARAGPQPKPAGGH